MPERQAGYYWIRLQCEGGKPEPAEWEPSRGGRWIVLGDERRFADSEEFEVLAGPLTPPSQPEIEGEPV